MSSHAPDLPRTPTASGVTVGCLVGAGLSAALLVATRLTSDLLVGTMTIAALAATTVVALGAAAGSHGPMPVRVLAGGAACVAGVAALLALADRPAGVAVPIGSLVLAAAVVRSRWLLGTAVVLGMVSVVVFA